MINEVHYYLRADKTNSNHCGPSYAPSGMGIFIYCSPNVLHPYDGLIISSYPPIFCAVLNLPTQVWLVLLPKYLIPEPIIEILAMSSASIRKLSRRQMQYMITVIKSSLKMRGLHNTPHLTYTISKTRSKRFRFPPENSD